MHGTIRSCRLSVLDKCQRQDRPTPTRGETRSRSVTCAGPGPVHKIRRSARQPGSPECLSLSRRNGRSAWRWRPLNSRSCPDERDFLLTPISASGCAASGSAAGTTGIRNPQSWRGVSVRRWILPGMARFEHQDLSGAEFRECDLTRARLIGVVMQDAVIDGLVSNLVVNGVEVTSYVEAELDCRRPVRLLVRSADPADLQEASRQLREDWAATLGRLRGMPKGSEHQRVGGEWSAVETLRHPVFVHDSWFRRCCLGSTERQAAQISGRSLPRPGTARPVARGPGAWRQASYHPFARTSR